MLFKKSKRKAYLRTLEAMIAVGLTLFFLAIIHPWQADVSVRTERIDILSLLEHNPDFRTCVVSENTTCANAIIQKYVPGKYNYTLSINSTPGYIPALPDKKTVLADSMYIRGNDTLNKPKIVRLYYWVK